MLLSIILLASIKYVQKRKFSVTKHCGAFAEYFCLQRYPNSLIEFQPKGILWRFNVAGNSKTCILFFKKISLYFVTDFNQIRDCWTGFYKSFKYQILRKYGQNDPRWYICKHTRTWRRLKMFFASIQGSQSNLRCVAIKRFGPINDLVYVNDIWKNFDTSIILFADDCRV